MARHRWLWSKCVECRRRVVVYQGCIPICSCCFEAGCRIDNEQAVPGELRSQRVSNLRRAWPAQHRVRSV